MPFLTKKQKIQKILMLMNNADGMFQKGKIYITVNDDVVYYEYVTKNNNSISKTKNVVKSEDVEELRDFIIDCFFVFEYETNQKYRTEDVAMLFGTTRQNLEKIAKKAQKKIRLNLLRLGYNDEGHY